VIRALVVLAAALPLAGQPKLLVNANLDSRSAATGLDAQYRAILAQQPQPAWIGYSVPSIPTFDLGCEYVRNGVSPSGTLHLEPPMTAVILLRVEAGAVMRIRTISPDCELDGGGLPFHWLTEVQPGQSVALLKSLAAGTDGVGGSALRAIGWHNSPAADAALESFLDTGQPYSLRQQAVSVTGSSRGQRGIEVLQKLVSADPDERIRERAVAALSGNRDPRALDLVIATARSGATPRLRIQAVSALSGKAGKRTVETLTAVAESDKDAQVRRRAVTALQSVPDGEGVPTLIQLARRAGDLELRKQAVTTLGQSRDPRAIAFLEEMLK
jgi:hypothetical protein